MINHLIKEELRNICGCPEKFQLVDLGGTLFGLFFILDGILRIKKGETGMGITETLVGVIGISMHSNKFFNAPQRK